MSGPSTSVFLFALIPVAALLFTGILSIYRSPGERINSAIQHFAAGLVFAAVAVELLPGEHGASPVMVSIGFGLGVVFLLVLETYIKRVEKQRGKSSQGNIGFLIVTAIDILIDGLLIGLSFELGSKQGILVAIALSAEFGSLGLTLSVEMEEMDFSPVKRRNYLLGLALLPLFGAAVGILVLSSVSRPILSLGIAFAIAALLYLVTEELLVEAHRHPDEQFATAMFFVGFFMILIIDMLTVG